MVITSMDELTAALRRAEYLMGCTCESDEEAELADLADAIEAFQTGRPAGALIECELDCQRVSEHIAELAGCLEDSEEERKLALLVESFERWEERRWAQ
ncbi:hypothetical protein [Bosea sp. BK604]|uniref:hypothetical protein n=1 Tax=Bosea sp. BK604 TaxID=2512180 RepID=UPI001049CA81|nr:hypothetical protein [Bosea sp. BK604]TCR64712.1 hypothetical protein EV560_106178 [Bosea sp. BK604]